MTSPSNGPSMSQKIFSKNLSVETVSLYLLCCAIADTGSPITKETLMEKWNGSSQALERELGSLENKRILIKEETEGIETFRILGEKEWL